MMRSDKKTPKNNPKVLQIIFYTGKYLLIAN